MGYYDIVDMDSTIDSDFIIGNDGDIKDTSFDLLQSIVNEIRVILRSETNDWQIHPEMGSGLKDFIGEPNTRNTADTMRDKIISSLTFSNVIKENDLSVRIVPVHMNQVLVIIRIVATSTPNNRLKPGETINISFTYDTVLDDLFFLPSNQLERNAK